jgi:hypothetical protein
MTTIVNLVIISALFLNIILIVIFVKMAANIKDIKELLIQINFKIMNVESNTKIDQGSAVFNQFAEGEMPEAGNID